MSVYSDLRYKDKLKHLGHNLIEEIHSLGVKKPKSYKRMARIMGLPLSQVHFSSMTRIEDLEQMVAILENFKSDIERHQRKKKPRPVRFIKKKSVPVIKVQRVKNPYRPRHNKEDVLPRDQYLKAMAELKEAQKLPIEKSPLRKLLERIGVIH